MSLVATYLEASERSLTRAKRTAAVQLVSELHNYFELAQSIKGMDLVFSNENIST